MNEDEKVTREEFEEVKKTVKDNERILGKYLRPFFIISFYFITKFFLFIFDLLKSLLKYIFI